MQRLCHHYAACAHAAGFLYAALARNGPFAPLDAGKCQRGVDGVSRMTLPDIDPPWRTRVHECPEAVRLIYDLNVGCGTVAD